MSALSWEISPTRAIAWLGRAPFADIELDKGKFKARVGCNWTRREFYRAFDSMEEAVDWVKWLAKGDNDE